MPEFVRSIKIRVEVDTNKDTYVLDLDDVEYVDAALREVRQFIASASE